MAKNNIKMHASHAFCFILSLLLCHQHASSLQFSITRFDPTSNEIIYEGDAKASVGAIDFTSASYSNHVGRATYAEKLQLWDSNSGKVTDFITHFTFMIDIEGRAYAKYGSGLAFFLAPADFQVPMNSVGGFLGLYNTTNSDSSTNSLVHVEFDPHADDWDPNYEHIGINKNSIASTVNTRWNVTFHSGDNVDVTITYNATTNNLTVSWSFEKTPNPNENTSLTYLIDLKTILPERTMVGFSAATGCLMERHFLGSWDFNSSLVVKESKKENLHRIILGVTIPAGALLAVFLVGMIVWRRKQRYRKTSDAAAEGTTLTSINDDLARGAGPRRFAYADLASATNNFSNDRKLGEGGFGAVCRGYIQELNVAVAVKKISRGSKQGRKEYITEVKTISSLRHRNLVQLIGWCHEEGEFLLVYELMPNGSLDSHLFGRKPPLTWPIRYKISLGLASAIFYLHEEWEQCVIHRDIKSSNVMLDSNFNARLGDFGLARLTDHELGPHTTGLAGTLGYLAPDYISTGRASKESDIYSFGVVALEIATGKKAFNPRNDESFKSLVEWVWDHYGSGKLLMAIDDRMNKDLDEIQVNCLMIVGLWCAHPDRNLRPSMRQVVQVLNFEAGLPNIPSTMPLPLYHVPTALVSSGEPLLSSIIEEGR